MKFYVAIQQSETPFINHSSDVVKGLHRNKKRGFERISSNPTGSATVSGMLIKLQKYLDDHPEDVKVCPQKHWKDHLSIYPSLAEVAKKVFGIPSSSAAVEYLFSIAGNVFSPYRCRLGDDNFQKLTVINKMSS